MHFVGMVHVDLLTPCTLWMNVSRVFHSLDVLNEFTWQVVVSRRETGIRRWARWLREDLGSRPYAWTLFLLLYFLSSRTLRLSRLSTDRHTDRHTDTHTQPPSPSTHPNQTKPNHNKTKQNKTKLNKTKQNKTKQNNPNPNPNPNPNHNHNHNHNHQPPTTNHQPPTTNHQPPTTNHHHPPPPPTHPPHHTHTHTRFSFLLSSIPHNVGTLLYIVFWWLNFRRGTVAFDLA